MTLIYAEGPCKWEVGGPERRWKQRADSRAESKAMPLALKLEEGSRVKDYRHPIETRKCKEIDAPLKPLRSTASQLTP